jgi:hypothetical protein
VTFHLGVQVCENCRRLVAIRQMHLYRGEVALAEREIVDLSGDAQQRRGPAGLVDRQPTLGKLIDSEPVADNSSRPHGVADHGQHAQGKAHPILKAAAVLIVPPVAQWRHELLEQIALRAVHLHPVKPGCHYMGRGCTKAVH